jgi:hypothetical protein
MTGAEGHQPTLQLAESVKLLLARNNPCARRAHTRHCPERNVVTVGRVAELVLLRVDWKCLGAGRSNLLEDSQ